MGSEERKLPGSRATTEAASDVDETAMSLESHGDDTIECRDSGITNSRSLAGSDDESRVEDHDGSDDAENLWEDVSDEEMDDMEMNIEPEHLLEYIRQTLITTPEGYPERRRLLGGLGEILFERYLQTGTRADLDESIQASRTFVEESQNSNAELSESLNELGARLIQRYSTNGSTADSEEAERAIRQSATLRSTDDPELAESWHHLGQLFKFRFSRTGDLNDLDEGIQFARQAFDAAPKHDPNWVVCANNLASDLGTRYSARDTVPDLEEAIQLGKQALEQATEDHRDYPGLLTNLGAHLGQRYSRTGAVTDLEGAIVHMRQAVSITPRDHPRRGMLLSNLGQYLGKRHLEIGALVDLEEAVELLREAVSIARDEHSDKAVALNGLGLELGARYRRTGAIADLDSAIQHIQEAISKVSKEDPSWLMYTSNLGAELGDRYLRTGAMVDLEEAIKCIREAIDAAPASHVHSAQLLSNLGIQLSSRYSRTKSRSDLEAAIETTRRGLDSTPDEHPNRMAQLDILAILLGYRYRESRDIGDLQEAIQTAQQAVDAAPENHPYKARLLNNLGDDLGSLYQRTEDITDLEQGLEYLQQAAQLMPLDYPERTALLCNLGDQLSRRHEKIGTMEDLENAINFYLEALHQSNAYTLSRIRAGRGILHCSTDWQQAHAAASLAVSLVPRLSSRSLQNSDRQHALSQVVGLASDAAAVALHAAETPLVALGLLEEGRGVLSTALDEVRADVLSLQDTKSDLAERFLRLREELETPTTQNPQLVGGNPGTTWRIRANRRYEAGKEFDALVDVIRELPGFENFLLPPGEAEIMAAARCGPIAVINVSQYRCDALLVEPHQIRLLPLPDLSLDEIKDRAWGSDLGDYEVLEWLWDTVTQPILHALGFTDPPTDDAWPHVWWIPTGPLSKFPLHAAGNHVARSGDTVLDRVMSSYASSIKAIIRGRRWPPDPAVSQRALLVAMEHTPGNDALPFAPAEVAMVRQFCAAASIQPLEPGNGKADIESHLPGSAIFHFAGHGTTDAHDASNSRILLADGALRVGELLDMNLAAQQRHPPPFLAYLSACGTGRIRDEGGVDESLHLMHAFQLAGFRHVVGTLWRVVDELCVDMARIMYEGMAVEGLTDEAVCRGLHFASRALRDRYLGGPAGSEDGTSLSGGVAAEGASTEAQNGVLPLRDVERFDAGPAPWAPYVHFGV